MTTIEERFLQGRDCHLKGDLDRAISIYQQVLAETPDSADAWAHLGAAYLAQNRLADAESALREALRRRPNHAAALDNLGIVHVKHGRHTEAIDCFRESLRWDPNHAETHCNLGHALLKVERWADAAASFQAALWRGAIGAKTYAGLGESALKLGRWPDAVASYREVVRLRPRSPRAHFHLAMALAGLGKLDEAAAAYRQVLQLNPGSAEALINLSNVLKGQGKLDEAIQCCQHALRLQPDRPETLNNLGVALQLQGRLAEAEQQFLRARLLKPNLAETHNNLGSLLSELGKIDEALAAYHEAARLKPHDPEVHYNLAVALSKCCRLDDALACLHRAVELQPDYALAHAQRAIVWLLRGDLEQGWPEYEWRWRCSEFGSRPGGRRPTWDGTPLAGRTILLHAEQGHGDAIQFVRYAFLIKERGGKVLVGCSKSLAPILARCHAVDQCVAHGSTLPNYDLECPLLCLPRIFGTTLDTIPNRVPYLAPDPDLVQRWRGELQGITGFKIGIAWQGNPQYKGDRQRSIPLARFAPLADVDGVCLISLQKGTGTEQLPHAPFPVIDLGSRLDDTAGPFMDTAAVMMSLDLVITSDTAIAHLAGALGVPVWLALPFAPDWRWLLGRDDSPWYPTMRLFRQPTPGDWDAVFQRLAGQLRQRLGSRPAAPLVTVETSIGELLDKITILEIKQQRIPDPAKLRNVHRELASLQRTRDRVVPRSARVDGLIAELKEVNERLWDVENDLRACERLDHFGPGFVDLARSVYQLNDRRYALKRRLNDCLGSQVVEEKSYADADHAGRDGGQARLNSYRVRPCRHGFLIYQPRDIYIGRALDLYGEYSEAEVALFRQLLNQGDVVLDVGANIGAHTVALARMTGPAGRIHAFEPQLTAFHCLCANVVLNQLDHVRCQLAAVGSGPGTIAVPHLDPQAELNFGGLELGTDRSNAVCDHVPLCPIDNLRPPRCDFIKIDVEGMEMHVLQGAQQTLRRCRPILYVEDDRPDRSPALRAFLRSLDYELYLHHPPLFNPENFRRNPNNVFGNIVSANLLCLPARSRLPAPADQLGVRRVVP